MPENRAFAAALEYAVNERGIDGDEHRWSEADLRVLHARRLWSLSLVAPCPMFILPTHALDLLAIQPRLRLFPAATLALTLLAALLVLAGVRATVAARRRLALPLSVKAIQVQVQEKITPKSAPKPASSWSPLRLSWETLPPPPASSPQPHVPRAGPVRRPEPALVSRPRAEAPLPAIYESPTPVSMAKMIMNRHTYRRPSPSPSRPSSSSRRARSPPASVSRTDCTPIRAMGHACPSHSFRFAFLVRRVTFPHPDDLAHAARARRPTRAADVPRAPQIQHLREPASRLRRVFALAQLRRSIASARLGCRCRCHMDAMVRLSHGAA
ncbi:hypothetical protein DFH09DRAFT_1313523 [Mycena vulgaris]|nr:hypothetical protein DFH09DRAFT_1313523 [Mycena vulgaris]